MHWGGKVIDPAQENRDIKAIVVMNVKII